MNSHFYPIQDSCTQLTSSEYANGSLRRCFSIFMLAVIFVLMQVFSVNAQSIVFTGDAEADFAVDGVFVLDDEGFQDVGVPPAS